MRRKLTAAISGNGECHCVHLTELATRVGLLEAWKRSVKSADPWTPGYVPAADFGPNIDPTGSGGAPAAPAGRGPTALPLDLGRGTLGGILHKDRPLLDDKMALHDDYRYNGTKGGFEWKEAMENYIISKAGVMRNILQWAEDCDDARIDEDTIVYAVSSKITEEQILTVNANLWGYLSA